MSSYRLQEVLLCLYILLLAELPQSVFSGLPGFSVTTSLSGQFAVTCAVSQSFLIKVFLSF